MIEAIARKIWKPFQSTSWDVDAPLDVEDEAELERPAVEGLAPGRLNEFEPSMGVTARQYYSQILRTAMANGGSFMGYQISPRWLWMTLEGLEGREVDVDELLADQRFSDSYRDSPLLELPEMRVPR
jgi:hypothetical protein